MTFMDEFSQTNIESFEVTQMKGKLFSMFTAGFGMLILILDTKTALAGAAEGLTLCLRTVIPSLFPFLLLSILLTSALKGVSIPLIRPLCRWMHIPRGAEYLYLIGLLGGYPVGAQSIVLARCSGNLSQQDASRMLPVCNNAGPAFLFGIGTILFEKPIYCFLLWLVMIVSSVILGILMPTEQNYRSAPIHFEPISISRAMRNAVQTMALICGWVVLFRVLLTVMERWLLWLLPEMGRLLIYGLLEITNGCCSLGSIQPMGLQFILFGVFLSFGGCCVTMQTASILHGTGISLTGYLPGKIVQGCLSVLLSVAVQPCLPVESRFFPGISVIVLCAGICIFYFFLGRKQKKDVAFRRKLMYNG